MRRFFLSLFFSLMLFALGCTLGPYDSYNQGSTGGYNPYGDNPPGSGNNPGGEPGNNPGGGPGNNPGGGPGNSLNPNLGTLPGGGNIRDPYGGSGNIPPVGKRDLTFPYELIPDTLTAITCPQRGPFSLRLGAYVSHGLQISSTFLEKNKITKRTDYRKTRQLIERSPLKGARARLAIQNESDLRQIYGAQGGGSLVSYFPPFATSIVFDHLSRLIPLLTTRSSSARQVGAGGKWAASLPMTGRNFNYFARQLAPGDLGELLLTLTYVLNKKTILSDAGPPYGRGYKLVFADQYKADYLEDVLEDHLPEAKPSGRWDCPAHLVFPIHRAESARGPFNFLYQTRYKQSFGEEDKPLLEGYCDTRQNSLDSSQARFFETVFGQARQWPFRVGKTVVFNSLQDQKGSLTNETCIILRSPGCYNNSAFYRIEFDRAKLKKCQPLGQSQNHEDRWRVCPAFLSTCYRLEKK